LLLKIIEKKLVFDIGMRLGEGGDFHHPPRRIDAENKCLINLRHLADCGALNRHFLPNRCYVLPFCPPNHLSLF